MLKIYLRDQVIRGRLRGESSHRPVDVLNEASGGAITLDEASARGVHAAGSPIELGTVRVPRAQILFAIALEVAPQLPRQLRTGFVEKRPQPVTVGVGPFVVSGTIHVGRYDSPTLEASGTDTGRGFVALTRARLTSQDDPEQPVDAIMVLLNRAAITYTCPVRPA